MDLSVEKSHCGQRAGKETLDPLVVSRLAKRASCSPKHILLEEFRCLEPSFHALNIGFSVSRAKGGRKRDRQRKPPYFACCYDVGSLAHVNVVAFYYPLIADWELMEADPDRYRQRVQSAVREEMISCFFPTPFSHHFLNSSELMLGCSTYRRV